MSFRGGMLVINGLVVFSLWKHLLVLEPPKGLLKVSQAFIIDFFLGQVALGPAVCFIFIKDRRGLGSCIKKVEKQLLVFFFKVLICGTKSIMWRHMAGSTWVDGLGQEESYFFQRSKESNLSRIS